MLDIERLFDRFRHLAFLFFRLDTIVIYIEKNRNYSYTGELHPNEVADPANANTALIDSPAPHMPNHETQDMLDKEYNGNTYP
jgi:hypothetical protein